MTFSRNTLQQFWNTLRHNTLKQKVATGEARDIPEAYANYAIEVMQDSNIIAPNQDMLAIGEKIKAGHDFLDVVGFACDEDAKKIDLFINATEDIQELLEPREPAYKLIIRRAANLIINGIQGRLKDNTDNAGYGLLIDELKRQDFDAVTIYVITNNIALSYNYSEQAINDEIVVYPQVIDIQRLYRGTHSTIREEVVVDLKSELFCGTAIPCVINQNDDYDCILTAIPANTLKAIYKQYGARILESNVRSFLSFKRKVNQSIRSTLRNSPEYFIAYNNGLVVTTLEANVETDPSGQFAQLSALKGPQIVNGGQTTIAICTGKTESNANIDLDNVWIPVKIMDLHKLISKTKSEGTSDPTVERILGNVAEFANTQNAVKKSDLSSNIAWNMKLEQLSQRVFRPVGKGDTRWFFERTAGAFTTLKLNKSDAQVARIDQQFPEIISKADIAKYIYAWDGKPNCVALGKEKNYQEFLKEYVKPEVVNSLDEAEYRNIISKAILYRTIFSETRKLAITHYPENTTAYLVSMIGRKYGTNFNFDLVWRTQTLSSELRVQLAIWIKETADALQSKLPSGGNPSEWAKREDCLKSVNAYQFSPANSNIPELK